MLEGPPDPELIRINMAHCQAQQADQIDRRKPAGLLVIATETM
jgi:hypothetical protein